MFSRSWRQLSRRYSQAVTFRTNEYSPTQHNEKQEGLFYTMKPELCKQLFSHGGFPKSFMQQTKTFTETAVMVRQPALDLISCIKASDLNHPAIRYVLYGEKGSGKSLTLAHVLHYAHEDGYLIVHVPWVNTLYFRCKTFVAIDGFNSFFYPLTRLNTPTKKAVKPEEVTLTTSFLKLTLNDWTNAVIVVTADQLAVPDDHQESFLPRYLLYKKGFDHLDPFVPIEVGRYNEKEFQSCVAYYRDRLWLRGPAEVETELKFTSACNPYRFMEQCAPL
ncbi:hypothetical protein HF086_006615 [Spodoptera exigua]|uniref:Small ribosomal subunit protein mS29 n=1 Tax=Spodoptera exigua TaxID=7107 RepID=A0A922SBY7_SPOEX|nr:hypothetical protein HF086_006615 [Spodoptera exigua]